MPQKEAAAQSRLHPMGVIEEKVKSQVLLMNLV